MPDFDALRFDLELAIKLDTFVPRSKRDRSEARPCGRVQSQEGALAGLYSLAIGGPGGIETLDAFNRDWR